MSVVSAIYAKEYKDIKILESPRKTILLYHYLHKKNARLLKKLTNELEKMKKRIEEIYDDFFKGLAEYDTMKRNK